MHTNYTNNTNPYPLVSLVLIRILASGFMLSIAEIIRLSWNTYVQNFKKYLPLLCALFIFSTLNSFVSFYVSDISKAAALVKILSSGLATIVFYLLGLGITVLLVIFSGEILAGRKKIIKIKETFFAVYWPTILISVLAGLITLGGYLAFVVPGILFTVWYAFAVFITIIEKKKGVSVLKESRELSRGRFWPVLGRIIVPGLFWGVLSWLVLAGIFNIIGLIINQSIGQSSNIFLSLLNLFISDLVAVFFGPLSVIGMVIVYREVRK